MGKKAKLPKAPDLQALNTQQVELNKGAATDVMNTNRYGQETPFASNEWVTGPDGKVTNVTKFAPEQQALYDKNIALAQQMTGNAGGALGSFMNQYWGGAAGGGGGGGGYTGGGGTMAGVGGGGLPSGLGSASGSYKGSSSTSGSNVPGGIYAADAATGVGGVGGGIQKDLDYSKLSAMPGEDIGLARQQAQDALYGRSTGYLDPQWQESQRSTETQLANQGLTPGTPAYDRAYANLQRAKEAAYTGARQDAIAGGGAEAARAQEMALQLRNQGITEAGNLGAFHNAAQGQRANQLLNDVTSKRQLEGTLGAAQSAAGASMSNAALANQLGQRNAAFNEAMQMAQFGKGGQMTPNFGISQGNMGNYGTGDMVGAASKDYQNQVARAQANSQSGLGGMLPMIGQVAGTMFGGPLGGMAGSALGGMFGGGGKGIGYGMASPEYAGAGLPY